MQAIPLRLTP
ncbi:Protein of unknown function [Bacillus cereus]|uniref:Uncharacterized protein n=2 Tax=Bacillus cereus group TaxID=86661 RepID=A0A1C4EZR5_BACTU|nr:Protein of unknown function [Bacillus wiedmannii]SCC48895.1 Protein of unknown function [Bacillus thuringiensis]SCC49924.1 Protein of unknown function [Bacillus cereus]SCN09893.1 Protein of unknown function [Bacillus wiedmannii]SCN36302.1 Protein of unknown function [Bacillus wiedmannii]